MPAYSISYDLKNKEQSVYDELEKNITEYCTGYIKYCETSWIVYCSGSAQALYNKISKNIKNGDRLLVIKVVNDYQGFLTDKQWETIKSFFK